MNTEATPKPQPAPPLPLRPAPEFITTGNLKRVACWYPQDLTSEWVPLAGPFYPGTLEGDDDLLGAHAEQVEGTWSVVIRKSAMEFWIYQHHAERDPFIVKSGSVFVRPDYAPWRMAWAEYWAERGNIQP